MFDASRTPTQGQSSWTRSSTDIVQPGSAGSASANSPDRYVVGVGIGCAIDADDVLAEHIDIPDDQRAPASRRPASVVFEPNLCDKSFTALRLKILSSAIE